MTNEIKNGIWPVMVTPFDADKNIVYSSLNSIVDFYVDNGCDGIFATCMTSEVPVLSTDEIIRLVGQTVDIAASRIQVVAGAIIFESLEKQAELIKRLYDTGADAVVVAASQICGKSDSEDVFKANIAKLLNMTGDIPLGMYESPYPYHRILSADTYGHLASTERFVFHKDTSCNINAINAKLERSRDTEMKFFNAHCATLLDSLRSGAHGYCGVGTNYYPEFFVWLYENYNTAAPSLVEKVYSFLKDSEKCCDLCNAYPATAKSVLKLRGVDIEYYCKIRPNLPDQEAMDKLRELVDAIYGIRDMLDMECLCVK